MFEHATPLYQSPKASELRRHAVYLLQIMTRRSFALTLASATAAAAQTRTKLDGTPPRSAMGIATTCFMTYGKPRFTQPGDTLAFLEHCNTLGAGGIQAPLAPGEDLKKLRARAEALNMYIETMAPFPSLNDAAPFEAAAKAAREAGAVAIRVGSNGGRRYEKWNSPEEWSGFLKESGAVAQKLSDYAAKEKQIVGLENHKDWTIEELVSGMKHLANDYFGLCLDFGNNIALLDPPALVLELAQYAKLTHVKDVSVEPYSDGFLMSEVVLGEGMLDVKKIVAAVREKQPKTRFTLEMITREPLQIPCLTDKFWATFPTRSGRYLARGLKLAQYAAARSQPLPRYNQLDATSQKRAEEENVRICLHYGREQLGL